jgi:hypothetical protein
MAASFSRAVKLCGTEEAESASQVLQAGPLSVELENGGLRYVRFHGIEVLRGISFLVRDENWGTLSADITDLRVDERGNGFSAVYKASCASGNLTYDATIEGRSDGSLDFRVVAQPQRDILTNRAGFVVLHPIDGVAGQPVRVTHVDASEVLQRFPERISPGQPIFDIRALAHEAAPGMWVTCRMEGDAFEMEDQRNWSDASFKTYIRSLSRPRPYVLEKSSRHVQSVHLSVSGSPAESSQTRSGSRTITVRLGGDAAVPLPQIGVGVPEAEASHALTVLDRLRQLGPKVLVCQVDLRDALNVDALEAYRRLADATAAELCLEIVVGGVKDPIGELQELAIEAKKAGVRPGTVIVTPASDLMSHQPGQEDPTVWPARSICASTRATFPGVRVGGGMLSYFTELNRKRPPVDLFDFVTHTTCPLVHAADDRSVMETLEALPAIIDSTRAFIGAAAYRVGPSAIGCRSNPYGKSTSANPGNGRVCLAEIDPRQRGLLNAAWTLGYISAFAAAGVEAVTLGAPTGPFGYIYRRTDYRQPFFDEQTEPTIYPAFHVMAGLAGDCGSRLLTATNSAPRNIDVLAYRLADGGTRMWVANRTPSMQEVQLSGLTKTAIEVAILDESSFDSAAIDPAFLDRAKTSSAQPLILNPYSVARIDATA